KPAFPLDSTHPPNLPPAATPICSSRPTSSEPGPTSAFIEVSDGTCFPLAMVVVNRKQAKSTQGDVPAHKSQPPGAVIDSVVSHSPGVFSGTFSGTLAPCSHGGISHPRRGIAIILQILNDLLRAACHHQGALLPPLCSHLTAEDPCMGRNRQPPTQSTERSGKTNWSSLDSIFSLSPGGDESQTLHSSEENKTMHCKMERLQLLMHQRRRQRRIRR
uniref:Midnolin-like n=1 Tax=Poecilia formosa TaxID=48698 RepID=A0A096LWV5_POEFO